MKVTLQTALAIVITLLSVNLQAQTFIGIRGGINAAGINPPNEISGVSSVLEDIITANIAFVSEFELGEKVSFQPELAYTRKGFKIEQGIDLDLFNVPVPLGVKAVTSFDYLEIPLLLKYNLRGEGINAHVFAGPSMGYAISGKLKTKANFLFEIPISETDLNLDNLGYKRFEVGGVVGAGLSFDAKNGKFFVDARYTHGFTELYDVPVIDLKVKNKNFGINVGYMIPLL